MVMPYHLHMPSYFLETFTEYPSNRDRARWEKYLSSFMKIRAGGKILYVFILLSWEKLLVF